MTDLEFQKARGDDHFKALTKAWSNIECYQKKISELREKLNEKDSEIYRLKCQISDLKFDLNYYKTRQE